MNSKKIKRKLKKELTTLENSLRIIQNEQIPYPKIFWYTKELSNLINQLNVILIDNLKDIRSTKKLFAGLAIILDKTANISDETNKFLLHNLDINCPLAFDKVTKSIYTIMEISGKFNIELINQYHKKTKKGKLHYGK